LDIPDDLKLQQKIVQNDTAIAPKTNARKTPTFNISNASHNLGIYENHERKNIHMGELL